MKLLLNSCSLNKFKEYKSKEGVFLINCIKYEYNSHISYKYLILLIKCKELILKFLENIKSLFVKSKPLDEELGINFGHSGEGWARSYSIDGVGGVAEFNYLFSYILSKQDTIDKEARIQDQDNIKLYSDNHKLLIELIDTELAEEVLREESSNNIPHELAVNNMEKLKKILITLHEYHERSLE